MGERHNLEFINIMNEDASLNLNVPEKYQGLSAKRKRVVEDLKTLGLVEKIEDYVNQVGFRKEVRAHRILYVRAVVMKMTDLAGPALDVVKNGEMHFILSSGRRHIITGWTTSKIGA